MMQNLTAGPEVLERKERVENLDFKMVTFSLAGKEYGIDIMNVKEIAKAGKFTYVPNAAPFLRGVYNLRGDIIPIIDLRIFFHLPAGKKEEDALESMLILRMDDHIFGVIVDNIDKVVAVSSNNIQPPHPIFGDINIKYIRGVIENASRLYIILDVERIFSQKEEEKARLLAESNAGNFSAPIRAVSTPSETQSTAPASNELEFIQETLEALKNFCVTPINIAWTERRFEEWKSIKKDNDLQLKSAEDAEEFLSSFNSPNSGCFWDEEYANAVMATLPDIGSKNIQVWNPGCGKGYETWSFACVLRKRYPDAIIRIWAHDNDLLAISNAPNMVFNQSEVPQYIAEFMIPGRNGMIFEPAIKDSVFFEYHDILNANPLGDLDIVIARDLLSFLSANNQARVFEDITEKLKAHGMVLLGMNETLASVSGWRSVGNSMVSAFIIAE